MKCSNRYGHTAESSMNENQEGLQIFTEKYMKPEDPTAVVSDDNILKLFSFILFVFSFLLHKKV